MNFDGTGVTNLSRDAAADFDPTWSPDGVRLAFTTDRDGNFEIYTTNVDGTGTANLTSSPALEGEAAWSPDGSRISFYSDRDSNFEIYSTNLADQVTTRLTNQPFSDFQPDWSPDGTSLAFLSNRDGNYEIYSMHADGSGQLRLTRDARIDEHPAWSPDGARILFARGLDTGNADIWVMNADGTGQATIVSSPGNDRDPDWQPFPTSKDQCINGGWRNFGRLQEPGAVRRVRSAGTEGLACWTRPKGVPDEKRCSSALALERGAVRLACGYGRRAADPHLAGGLRGLQWSRLSLSGFPPDTPFHGSIVGPERTDPSRLHHRRPRQVHIGPFSSPVPAPGRQRWSGPEGLW